MPPTKPWDILSNLLLPHALSPGGSLLRPTGGISLGCPGCCDAFGKPCPSKHVAHSLQSRGFRAGTLRANCRFWWRQKETSAATPEPTCLLGSSWALLEEPFLTIEEGRVKSFHNSSQHVLLIHSGTHFKIFSQKWRCHTLLGQLTKTEEVWWPPCTLRTHLKGRLRINLDILVVILLVSGEDLFIREDIFVSILGVPLEETLCSCPLTKHV
jgi:hypothetical protein